MPLSLVSTGGTILATNVNQLVNVLQRSSGQSEVGHYICIGSGYVNNATISTYYASLSRGVTPASSSVDASIVALTGATGLTTGHLDAYCIQIYCVASPGAGTNIGCAGVITINY